MNIFKSYLVRLFITLLLLGNISHSYCQYRKPNIVLIISDDHRHDWMGHKNKVLQTPNLDRLATQGWSFPNAFGVAGVCAPARASLLTGKYMHQASAPDINWDNHSFLFTQEMFPQKLHRQGYKTGYIGKFHLGEDEKPKKGFDLWASFPYVGNHFDQSIWINGKEFPKKGFTDDNLSALADSTIRKWASSEEPFCLIVALKSPHIPFTFPERMNTKYDSVLFKEPFTYNLDYSKTKPGLSKNLINAKTWRIGIPQYGSFQQWVRAYSRMATTVDESVGAIMKAVAEAGIEDNTIFIYTSDQGYSLGEFSLCEKHYAYEQVMRVPMIARFPNQPKPNIPPTDMVSLMDIAPTIMDYCTGKIPVAMMGKSWRGLMEPSKNNSKPFRAEVFFDFWHNMYDSLPPMQAVRTERYKLISYEYQPFQELYDLKNDPLEINNLIENRNFKKEKDNLNKKLTNWKKQTGWMTRSSVKLNAVYISKNLKNNNITMKDVTSDKLHWKKLERENGLFDFSGFIPATVDGEDLYIAIPVKNEGKFDPFISLRISNDYDKNKFPLTDQNIPLTGYFEGEGIYTSIGWKTQNGISTASYRGGFDHGFNPPLRSGDNVILFKLDVTNKTPEKWDISLVGGISYLKF